MCLGRKSRHSRPRHWRLGSRWFTTEDPPAYCARFQILIRRTCKFEFCCFHVVPNLCREEPHLHFAPSRNLGFLFLTEFLVDSYIGIVIWACLDPANPFVSAASAPFAIGLAYATMVWGFADISISTNLARDLGTRIVAAIFFGGEAFSYMNYSWIAILVNVPATLFATGYYEFLMRDSLSKIGKGHAVHEDGEEGLQKHITRTVRGLSKALGSAKGTKANCAVGCD